ACARFGFGHSAREELPIEQAQATARVREAKPVAVERIVVRQQVPPVEAGQEPVGTCGVGSQKAVQPLKEERPEPRRRLASPEAANLVLAEDVVAGEQLVRPLSGEDDV